MKSRNLVIFIAVAILAGVAWNISEKKAPQTELASTPLLPDLIDKLNDVERITLRTDSKETILKREQGAWVLAGQDGYPAKASAIKQALLQLSELKVIEKKTSDPEKYRKIGVSDIGQDDPAAQLVTVSTGEGDPIVSLIVGNERLSAHGTTSHYVRHSADTQSVLAEGKLVINPALIHWTDMDVVNIPTKRIHKVTIRQGDDEAFSIKKSTPEANYFDFEDLPEGFEAKSKVGVSALGAFLVSVKFNDVASADHIADLTPTTTVEMRTFDGLIATAERYAFRDDDYVQFKFRFDADAVIASPEADPDDAATGSEDIGLDEEDIGLDEQESETLSVEEEVQALKQKVDGWIYALPKYKVRMIDKHKADLIKKIAPPVEPIEED